MPGKRKKKLNVMGAMKAVPYESELGRGRVLVTLAIADTMKPMERLKTSGYRKAISHLIQSQSYRKAALTFNLCYHRLNTSSELSMATLAEDIEQEGRDIRAAKMKRTREILSMFGFDPETTMHKEGGIPLEFQNKKCDTIFFDIKNLLNDNKPGWKEKDDSKESQYSLPDTAVFQTNHKRRGKRIEVTDEKKERTCVRYINWHNGKAQREYYGIIYNWQIEKSSSQVVYIAIDVVYVDKQSETRGAERPVIIPKKPEDSSEEDNKRIGHVDIVVEADDSRYYITDLDIDEAYRQLVAYLLQEKLCNRYLVFQIDGEDKISKSIEKYFLNRWEYDIQLDWSHLVHKIHDRMSNIVKGGKVPDPRGKIEYYKQKSRKDEIKKQEKIAMSQLYARELERIVWAGNIDEAISYVENLDPSIVKNAFERNRLVTYLTNKHDWITCYALRKQAGLRNSSNGVEGENRLLVADRQKNNGTSWCKTGSSNLASITCLFQNGEQDEWFNNGKIRFASK